MDIMAILGNAMDYDNGMQISETEVEYDLSNPILIRSVYEAYEKPFVAGEQCAIVIDKQDCEINGFNAYSGAGTMTFEGCTFGCDASNYNGLNIYSNTVLKNCTFGYVSGKTNFIDMEGTGKTLTIINCTATLDGAAAEVSDFVGGSKLANNTVIYQ